MTSNGEPHARTDARCYTDTELRRRVQDMLRRAAGTRHQSRLRHQTWGHRKCSLSVLISRLSLLNIHPLSLTPLMRLPIRLDGSGLVAAFKFDFAAGDTCNINIELHSYI